MKKVVVELNLHDAKAKQKAMKMVSTLSGIESIAMDMKENKLTVVGDVDPVQMVSKLRKVWYAEILTVGPAEEPEKKKDQNKQIDEVVKGYKAYCPNLTASYHDQSVEENPNACVIC